jgi:exodeoxyribonuclease III
MKIISYNLNGIRSAQSKGLADWIAIEKPDILHVQETKAQRDQVDLTGIEAMGYKVFWHSAQKKGYSGVATFSKPDICRATEGIGVPEFDSEGRFLRLDIGKLSLINSYFPSGTTGDIRQNVKEAYLEAVLLYLANLKAEGREIIISGDFNICHKPIDISKPENKTGVSGFLPHERQWMDRLTDAGFVDSFRHYDQSPEKYSWWSFRAGSRQRNVGWRIDYNFVSSGIAAQMRSASILADVAHSDHCPVVLEIDI